MLRRREGEGERFDSSPIGGGTDQVHVKVLGKVRVEGKEFYNLALSNTRTGEQVFLTLEAMKEIVAWAESKGE